MIERQFVALQQPPPTCQSQSLPKRSAVSPLLLLPARNGFQFLFREFAGILIRVMVERRKAIVWQQLPMGRRLKVIRDPRR